MSFRMRNSQVPSEQPVKEKKIYSQEEIDLVEAKYKEKERRMEAYVNESANPLLDQYKKTLSKPITIERESIIYDEKIGKWKLVKEGEIM